MGMSLPPALLRTLSTSIAAAALFADAAAAPTPGESTVPDKRWSRIYTVDPAAIGAEPVRQPRPYGSLVQSPGLPPQDSPDVGVKPSAVVTQSEVSAFVDPNDSDVLLVSTNTSDWNGTTVINFYGTGTYWTTNGGASWAGSDFGPGGVGNSGDPAAIIRQSDGRWGVGYINNGFGQGFSYSDDQGANWQHVSIFPGGTLDKNHLMVDNEPSSPHNGNIYSAWTAFGTVNVNKIEIVRSTNGGVSWSPAANISAGVASGSHDQGVNIQIGPNGEVYALWAIYDCWPCEEIAHGLNVSTNGGVSWQGEFRAIQNIFGHRNTNLPNTSIRRNSFPTMAVDRSGGPNHGAIYVAWTNQGVPGINVGDPDIYVVKSTNGGASFGTAVRVNQDAGTNSQWFPWLVCDQATGNLAITFYDRRDDLSNTQARVYMATSVDGGATWEDFAVSDVAHTPVPISGLAFGYSGDYIGLAVQDGHAYPAFCDNRTGNYLTYVSPILLAEPLDPNPPTGVTAFSDYTTPTSVDVDWTDATTFVGGAPLVDFSVDVLRDNVLITNVDQGIETFADGGLVDGQQYQYTLRTRDDVSDSLSAAVNVTVFAGGSPTPAAPTGLSCLADTTSATLSWTNPSTQTDGTTLDDFAGVRVYRNASFLVELPRVPGDAGAPDTYTDFPPFGFTYTYAVSAIDNESTVHESGQNTTAGCFVGGPPEIAVAPSPLSVNVPLSGTQNASITVSNPGYGFLNYSLALVGLGGGGREEFASQANSTSHATAFRGNAYEVTTDVTLTKIDHLLNSAAPTSLEFFVYSSPTGTGSYTKIFSTTVTSGTGLGFQTSGPISVPLAAGTFYFIGCGWQGALVSFDDAGSPGLPTPVSFGTVRFRGGGNQFPPPASVNINGIGTQRASQAVEVSVIASAALLSPASGSVPPLGNVVVDIQASAGATVGVVNGQLNVSHNATGGLTTIPVTLNAVDATDAPPPAVALPSSFALHAPRPNPTSQGTMIRFDLPRPEHVRLVVYDVAGRVVRTLVDRPEEAGFRTVIWDGRDGAGLRVGSGVYFYALEAGGSVLREKVVMLR
ncbi:MAG: FlgD immunoglobulin-like domain containing protein [Candidatus Eiseniibacteriota bacterium]